MGSLFFLVWQVVELESGWVDRGERSLMVGWWITEEV